MMDVLRTPGEAQTFTTSLRADGRTVGLVPTMGALHEGHLSLVRMSRERCDATIATIFVNPTQFGPGEDLAKYPRTFDEDCALLQAEGVTAVFAPSNEVMYPEGFSTYVEPPEVAEPLEGVCRPGHFHGVTTVVLKLFHAVPATHAFFGRKDYQQLKVIQAMTRDFGVPIEIVPGETVREPDGLAMSSRNRYLSFEQRERALLISSALERAEELVRGGEQHIYNLESIMRQTLGAEGSQGNGVDKIDYAVVVDAETLRPLTMLEHPAVALIAAHVGGTRLIDNRLLPRS